MTNGVDPGLKEGRSNIILHDCAVDHPHRRKAADPMKKILVLLGILTSLAILAVLAILLFLDINAHKPKIETAATQALGMEVKIQGKASLRLFPSVGISLADVRLRNRGTDLAQLGVLQVGLKLFPLLRREAEVTEFVLEKPDVQIEKGADGKFNYETPARGSKPAPSAPEKAAGTLFVRKSAIKEGRIRYLDRKTGSRLDLDGVDLAVTDLSLGSKQGADILQNLSFSGNLRVKEVKTGDVSLSDIQAAVKAANGIFHVRPFTMRMFGGSGQGEIEADLSKSATAVKVRYTLSNFRAEEALSAVSRKKYVSGPMTISPNLSFRGKGTEAMMRSMSGTVTLHGENLSVQGMDIDEVLSKAEETRNLNIADVGAFLLAGPLGTAVTKGYQYGGTYAASRGESRITKLVSEWSVANGLAEARDVAFATKKHRIAILGKLDIAGERFVDITVASLDGKGCAKISQKISGPFRNPTLDKVSMLQSAAAPLMGLFEQTKKILTPGECKPFYTGSVAPPQ